MHTHSTRAHLQYALQHVYQYSVYIHIQCTDMHRSQQTKQYINTWIKWMPCNPWSQRNMDGQFCGWWCCYGGLLQVVLKGQERGGGILVQVPESIRNHRRTDMERDAIWLVLHIEKTAILLCHIYRPPYSAKSLIKVLSDVLEQENKRSWW